MPKLIIISYSNSPN